MNFPDTRETPCCSP